MISDTAWSACSVEALPRTGVHANPVEKACASSQGLQGSPNPLCKLKALSLMPTTHLPSNPKTECQDWTVPAPAALPSASTWGMQVSKLGQQWRCNRNDTSFASKFNPVILVSRVTLRPVPEAGEEGTEAAGADLGGVPTPKSWRESEL